MSRRPTRLRAIYVLEKNGTGATAPSCEIEWTASGKCVFRVRATGRNLRRAREQAEAEFVRLARFARGMQE
jgi:hypothetical protein